MCILMQNIKLPTLRIFWNKIMKAILTKKKPKSLNVCALLAKHERRVVNVHVEYVGFTVPNQYIVGYGLDYRQKYRNLPYLAVLDRKDLQDE